MGTMVSVIAMRVIGTSHKLTPPSQLQRAVARKQEIFAYLLGLQASRKIHGAILLATCNRLEIILDSSPTSDDRDLLEPVLSEHSNLNLHSFSGLEATHYLLRVATGLDSMVQGEDQVLGQLREAFKASEEHGLLSPRLRNLRTQLIAVARETRQQAGMAKSNVSVASLATRQLEAHGQRIAIVGAGETGRLAIESLIKRGFTKLTIVNRTFPRAHALAQHFNIQALPLAEFLSMSEASDNSDWDSVLFAIDSRQPIFFARHAKGLRAIVDISMPCILDASVRDIDGLAVCDLDDIAKIVETETDKRSNQLGSVEKILQARSSTLHDKLMAASQGSHIHLGQIMDQHLDTAMQELQAVLSNKLSHLSNGDQKLIREVIIRAAKRNAHLHLKDVQELSKS